MVIKYYMIPKNMRMTVARSLVENDEDKVLQDSRDLTMRMTDYKILVIRQ